METTTELKNFSMLRVDELTTKDFEQIAKDAIKMSASTDEDEIYRVIGNGMHNMGLQTSSKAEVFFENHNNIGQTISPLKAFAFVADTAPLDKDDAKKEGKKFGKKFKENLKTEICSNQAIQDFINKKGNLTLKGILITLIPIILAALGIAVINPILLAIIVAALALLLKVGFKAYCGI